MVNCRRYSAETDRIAPNDNHCCRSPQTRDMQRRNTVREEKCRHVSPRLGALALGMGAIARARSGVPPNSVAGAHSMRGDL